MLCKASLYSFNVPITNKPNVALTEKNIILIIFFKYKSNKIIMPIYFIN